MLQIIGAVGKANPRYEKIILKLDKETAEDIISSCDKHILQEIESFTELFLKENYNYRID